MKNEFKILTNTNITENLAEKILNLRFSDTFIGCSCGRCYIIIKRKPKKHRYKFVSDACAKIEKLGIKIHSVQFEDI